MDHLRPTHVHSVGFGTARCLFRKQPMPVAVNQDPVTRAHARKADGRFLFRIQLYQLHPVKAYQRGKATKCSFSIEWASVTYCSMLPPESAVFAAGWFLVLFQGFPGTPLRVSAYRTFGQMATYGP